MAVIVGSMGLRLVLDFSMHSLAGLTVGLVFFFLYIVSRQLGHGIFLALIPFVLLEAGSVVWQGISNPEQFAGGFITSPSLHNYDVSNNYMTTPNYNIAAGFMAFGAIAAFWKWQWVLVSLAIVGMFFTGAPEAVFILAVMAVVMVVRRDWGKRIIVPLALLPLLAVLLIVGYGRPLYLQTAWVAQTADGTKALYPLTLDPEKREGAIPGRWRVINEAMSDIKPLGHGLELTKYTVETVHNVPLIITDQIGPVAGLAWLFIAVACLVRTKWKYAWAVVLTMGVFDHYIWTQMAPYWWVLAGVSSGSVIKSDYIFRRA